MRPVILCVAFALCWLGPQPLLAQQSLVTLLPRAGLFTQTGPFTMHFTDPPPEYQQVWRYSFAPSPVFGAAVEVRASTIPFPVRLEVNRAPSLVLKQQDEAVGPPFFEAASGRVTTATVAAVLEAEQVCWGRLCPRLLVGGGKKYYRFDATLIEWGDILNEFAENQNRTTVQLGAGLRARFSRTSLELEVNDFSNRIKYPSNRDMPSDRVHDTLVTLGVGYRLW